MFVLRTGLQGNGKTLNTIKEVDIKAAKEGRQVYFHNIRAFNPSAEVLQASWLPFDDPHKWHELPQNAIVVIDEAQTFFRVRKAGAPVPDYASALETMRHRGHELHCITQNPGLIDHHFRKLCNSHIHYVRGHKGKVIKRWEFERVNNDVEKRNNFADGQFTRILLDKKYFGVYQSVAEGSEHHMRFKPPRALIVLIVCIVVCSYLGYGFYQRRLTLPDDSQSAATPVEPSTATSVIPRDGAPSPVTTHEYMAMRIPRLPDVPSSAPIYDEITRPVSYPKLLCVHSSNSYFIEKNRSRIVTGIAHGREYGCRCNTQQGTRYDVSFEACMAYVDNGVFDHAVPDRQQAGSTGAGDAGAATGVPASGRSSAAVVDTTATTAPAGAVPVISLNNAKPGHLW